MKNPFFFDAKVNLFMPRNPTSAKVIENSSLIPEDPSVRRRPHAEGMTDVRHVILEVDRKDYPCRSGQSAGIVPAGEDPKKVAKGAKNTAHTVRLYSIASPTRGENGDGASLALTVTRDNVWDDRGAAVHRGVCSNYLNDLRVGDEVVLTGPSGKGFLLPEEIDRHLVFVATGTGIAPFRAFLLELETMGFDREIWLFFGVPYSDEVLYDDLFTAMEGRMTNFHYVKAISREQKNPSGGKMYVSNRVEEHREDLARLQREGCSTYICGGPKGMEKGIIPILRETSGDGVDDAAAWKKAASKDGRLFVETY